MPMFHGDASDPDLTTTERNMQLPQLGTPERRNLADSGRSQTLDYNSEVPVQKQVSNLLTVSVLSTQ